MKHTKWLGSIALSALLLAGFSGCDSSSSDGEPALGKTVNPYQRIAVIPGGWDQVNTIALKISDYIVATDESKTEAEGGLGFPTNWVIAGANPHAGDQYDGLADLLPIPAIGGKSRVIEFCNGKYAGMAMATGRKHGSALPCEVSVHSDGENIYVDMLDADAIFSIFFPGISDPNGMLEQVASDVKSELRTMILTALKDSGATESSLAMGPTFSEDDIAAITMSPYYVYKYKRTDGAAFVKGDDKILSKEIIALLGTDAATADTNVAGLSEGSSWRSARPDPIAIPGVMVAEACSPKYAKKATKLGNQFITALPCELTTYIDDEDDTNQTIAISMLSPDFMFGTMFKGAVEASAASGDINATEVAEYMTLAEVVREDLIKVIEQAIATSALGIEKVD